MNRRAFSYEGGRRRDHAHPGDQRSVPSPPTPRSGPWAGVSLHGSLLGAVEVEKRILTTKLRRALKGGTPEEQDHFARPGGGLASL